MPTYTTAHFGPWELDPDALVLRTDTGGGYEVDLEDCRTSAEMLDWIMQVAGKTWATDAVLSALVHALREVLNPQAYLCPSGRSKTLTRGQVRSLVDIATHSSKPHSSCPVCGRTSVLVRSLDRYMHIDGSANDPCWLILLREDRCPPGDAT